MNIPGRPIKIVQLLLLVGITFALAGCFEMSEDVWIYNDGSGRYQISIGMSEELLEMGQQETEVNELQKEIDTFKEEIAENPDSNIKSVSFDEESRDGYRYFTIDVEVKDMRAEMDDLMQELEGADTPLGAQNAFMTIEELPNGNLSFVRDLNAGQEASAEMELVDEADLGMVKAMMADRDYTVRLHTPDATIVSTNGKLDEDGKTVTWQLPMGEVMGAQMAGQPLDQTFEAEINISEKLPTYVVLGLGVGGSALIMLGALALIILARRRSAPATA